MSEAYTSDFLDDVALELVVIEKVAPLLVTEGPVAESTYDPASDYMNISLTINSIIGGMSLTEAVEKLGIRPLAFGSAWKVLDLLLEYALAAAGMVPRDRRRWTITEKASHAQAGAGLASPLSNDPVLWKQLLAAYVATEEVRHSLVHRRATVGAGGELTGVDRAGAALRPLSKDEQVHFMRAVQRTVSYLQQTTLTSRDEAALLGELEQLSALTGWAPTGHGVVEHPPIPYRVPVEEGQEIDLKLLKDRIRRTTPSVSQFDVRFVIGSKIYEVPLEDLPDEVVRFSRSASWLTR
jgi:hypothetical protein